MLSPQEKTPSPLDEFSEGLMEAVMRISIVGAEREVKSLAQGGAACEWGG